MRSLALILLLPCGAAAQLAPAPTPPQNPSTPAKVVLGKMLFWEEQLSSDDTMACGTCHRPEFGGSDGRLPVGLHPGADGLFGTEDDGRGSTGMVRTAGNGDFTFTPMFGLRPQATARMSPSVLGAGHHERLNWDGSASARFDDPETGNTLIPTGGALENQSLPPILSPVEMGHEGRTWNDVRTKLQVVVPMRLAHNLTPDIEAALQQSPSYPSLFAAAFGTQAITAARIAFAIAAYERTLNPDDTPWDRFVAGQSNAMTSLEQIGWNLFQGRGQCLACHQAPLFSDDGFHNLGLRPIAEDPGHGAINATLSAQGAFKTPSLRNAALRPRMFHNGASERLGHPTQFWTVDSTLNVHWLGGGVDPSNVDPLLANLGRSGVSQAEVALMLEFVRTALTDERAANRLPPFDHPDLRSMVEPAPRLFGPSLPGTSEPFLIDWVPPYPGNSEFKLGLVGGLDGSIATLTIGFQSIEPHTTIMGLPWHLHVHTYLFFPLSAAGGEPGHATWHVPLPNDPSLANVPLYYQMFVDDPLAPGGIAASQGSEFFIR